MSGINMNITVGIDYRPCMVHFPEQRKYFYENGIKKYRVKHCAKDAKAMFHCWSHRTETASSGQLSATYAIVEFEDGTVREIEPCRVQFCDKALTNE